MSQASDTSHVVSTLALMITYSRQASPTGTVMVMTSRSTRAADLRQACAARIAPLFHPSPDPDSDNETLGRTRFLGVDPLAVTTFFRTAQGGPPLLIIDATEGCTHVFERALELARMAVTETASRLVVLVGAHDLPAVRRWWPELPIVPSPNEGPHRPDSAKATNANCSKSTVARRWETSCCQLLSAGYSPYTTPLFHSPTPTEVSRAMMALEMIGIVDSTGSLTKSGRRAVASEVPPRLMVMGMEAATHECPGTLLPVLALLGDLPSMKKHNFYKNPPPYGGQGLRSDLAAVGKEFAKYASFNFADDYVSRRYKEAARLAKALGIEFSGTLSQEKADTRAVAETVTAGLIDHLAVATGEERVFVSAFFPEDSPPRKLYRGTQCEGAALVIGIPHDPVAPDGSPTEPRLALPTEVTPETIETVYPGSTHRSSEWRLGDHIGAHLQMLTLRASGRVAHLFIRRDREALTLSRDHIVEADHTLYVSGMLFSLDRGDGDCTVVARCEEDGYSSAALATIKVATGPILACERPVVFTVSRNARPIVARSWEELAAQLEA